MTSLNALIEAAKLVEYEKDGKMVSSKPVLNMSSGALRKQGLITIKRRREEEELLEESKRGRPGGAGTRETHNKLEKNRRAELKNYFQKLKQNIPKLGDKSKASNVSILTEAVKYIEELTNLDKEYEAERLRLRKCRMCLDERIFMLKEEIHRLHLQKQLFAQVQEEKKRALDTAPKEMMSVEVQANEQEIRYECSQGSPSSSFVSSSRSSKVGSSTTAKQQKVTLSQFTTSKSPVMNDSSTDDCSFTNFSQRSVCTGEESKPSLRSSKFGETKKIKISNTEKNNGSEVINEEADSEDELKIVVDDD